jgi:beta-xylosidase
MDMLADEGLGRNSSSPIQRTGHADLVSTPSGKWYLVFLGTRPVTSSGESPLGRETFLAPVTWKDGWPIVNNGNLITENMPGLYNLPRPKVFRDNFSGKLADKAYYTPRTPYKTFHSFPKSGGVRLKGNPYTLSHRETPAVLLRKQVDFNTVFSTQLNFDPRNNTRYEAGVTLFLSIHFHNEIAITAHPETGARTIVAKTRTGRDAKLETTYHAIPPSGPVKLHIKASTSKYELGFAAGTDGVKWVAEVESRWLQTYLEGWQVFTGTFFGIYATGNDWPILEPAVSYFWLIKYQY